MLGIFYYLTCFLVKRFSLLFQKKLFFLKINKILAVFAFFFLIFTTFPTHFFILHSHALPHEIENSNISHDVFDFSSFHRHSLENEIPVSKDSKSEENKHFHFTENIFIPFLSAVLIFLVIFKKSIFVNFQTHTFIYSLFINFHFGRAPPKKI